MLVERRSVAKSTSAKFAHTTKRGSAMSVPRDYLKQYNALPSADRKRIMHVLMYWGGWTKTSVYRKLSCPNLSPIEEILVSGVMQRALAHQADGTQLTIDFGWDPRTGYYIKEDSSVLSEPAADKITTSNTTAKMDGNSGGEQGNKAENGSILFP
jgi:hypothetical protein